MKAKMRTLLFGLLATAPAAAEVRVDLLFGYDFAPGSAANGSSTVADVSADGRYVAFSSTANNLVPGFADHNSAFDVLVLDRQSGAFDYVSLAAGGSRTAQGASNALAISDDGRYVFFASAARDLLTGVTYPLLSADQLYLFDRSSRTTTLISHAPGNPLLAGDRGATGARLSGDGRFAIFDCQATNWVLPPSSGSAAGRQVYLFDRNTGDTRLISHAAGLPGTKSRGDATAIAQSADGAFVLLNSTATDLIAGGTDSASSLDVFVYDLAASAAQLISRRAGNPSVALGGAGRDLSADGRYVLLDANHVGLVAGLTDGNGSGRDVFVFDRQSEGGRLLSHSTVLPTQGGNASSSALRLSADGRFVYFSSSAGDLIESFVDGNGTAADLFSYDTASTGATLASRSTVSARQGANGATSLVATRRPLSPDGRFALLATRGTDLAGGVKDTNGADDLYLYDRSAGNATLVSRFGGSLEAGGFVADRGAVSSAGVTAFTSVAGLDAAAADSLGLRDVFLFETSGGEALLASLTAEQGFAPLPGGGGNIPAVLTPDGRFAAWSDYVWDRQQDGFERVGHAAGAPGVRANGDSLIDAISPDGRFLALSSLATDLAAGIADANNNQDVFFYDRNVDGAFLVSHAAGAPAQTATGASSGARWMAPDARQFIFASTAYNLLAGQTGAQRPLNLFFYDRPTGSAELLSHRFDSFTEPGDNIANFIELTPDRRFLVFESMASNLIAGFVEGNDFDADDFGWIYQHDVYSYDFATRSITLVSHPPGLPTSGAQRSAPLAVRITASGAEIFYSLRLSTYFESGEPRLYRWDRATNESEPVTGMFGGPLAPCGDDGELADLTADGRLLLISTACAFVPGDTNGVADAYLVDRNAGSFQLISGQPGNPALAAGGRGADLSADGRRLIYRDAAGVPISVDRATGIANRLTSAYYDGAAGIAAQVSQVSQDGYYVLVSTSSASLVPFDANAAADYFLVTLADLFADGFEGGSTGAWSLTLP